MSKWWQNDWCYGAGQEASFLRLLSRCSVNKHWRALITVKEQNSLGHLDKWAVLSENMRAPVAQRSPFCFHVPLQTGGVQVFSSFALSVYAHHQLCVRGIKKDQVNRRRHKQRSWSLGNMFVRGETGTEWTWRNEAEKPSWKFTAECIFHSAQVSPWVWASTSPGTHTVAACER